MDVAPAADDEVLGPPGDPEVAVAVESPEVARVHPAFLHPRAPVVLIAHVPGEHTGAAHGDHADLVYGAAPPVPSVAVQLHHAPLPIRQGMAHRANPDPPPPGPHRRH